VVSSNPELLDRVRRLREYGWTPQARYISQEEGMNSRLDELQAAIIRARLRHLDAENAMRRTLAGHYARLLPDALVKPIEMPDCIHIYHLYVVRVAGRSIFRQRLHDLGVATAIHYPVPIHRQPAYMHHASSSTLLHTEHIVQEIVSLPMHPFLTADTVEHIAYSVRQALAG
jgi:dTDP-4-amino-4,6-dideoxygalactose transaminase